MESEKQTDTGIAASPNGVVQFFLTFPLSNITQKERVWRPALFACIRHILISSKIWYYSSMPEKKKRKFKLTTKGLVVVVILIGMILIGLFALLSRPSAIDRLSLTYLDNLDKTSLGYEIPDTYEQSYAISDYTIYGETLVLYRDSYQDEDYDDLYGKNVMLKNLETGAEQIFTFAGGADSGISLGQLDPGVYEVYVYDQYTKKRVYFEEPMELEEAFTTMRRNKEILNITLDADSDYLKKLGITQDRNYLYLTVTDSLPKVKYIDVLIDPSGLESYLNSTAYATGYTSATIDESAASYQFAEEIKSYLQEAGLRVEVTRSSNEANGYTGSDSRVGIGYAKQAKVFLNLAMSAGEADRPYIVVSPYTTGGLANRIVHVLEQNGIELYDAGSSTLLDAGATFDTLMLNDDYTYSAWEYYPQLRESGGKATWTGTLSSYNGNSDYSDAYGMYGMIFYYASDDSEESQTYFLTNEGEMAKSIAQGILEYFEIPEQSEETE